MTSFSFLLKKKTHISENEDAKKNENAKKKPKKANAKKTKTHKNEDAKERISIGALSKSLQIINSSFIKKLKKNVNAKKKNSKKKKKKKNAYFQERRRIFSRAKTQKKNENEDANSRRTMPT